MIKWLNWKIIKQILSFIDHCHHYRNATMTFFQLTWLNQRCIHCTRQEQPSRSTSLRHILTPQRHQSTTATPTTVQCRVLSRRWLAHPAAFHSIASSSSPSVYDCLPRLRLSLRDIDGVDECVALLPVYSFECGTLLWCIFIWFSIHFFVWEGVQVNDVVELIGVTRRKTKSGAVFLSSDGTFKCYLILFLKISRKKKILKIDGRQDCLVWNCCRATMTIHQSISMCWMM